VLVTSFVKTLPDVLSQLLRRLAPEVVERVEFVGVHALALRLLNARGVRVKLKPAEADLAFSAAWGQSSLREPLARLDPDPGYWRDEIRKVIKGRGLTDFDAYADLVRAGRRRGLNNDQRRSVWQLYLAYQDGLRARDIHDFDDVVLLAEASLRAEPLTTYGAVIIDEAQDMSCAMVRMLHMLVGDAPDGLTIIGDGQQSIYPGGFTLAEAGVSISGRSVIMTTNYRNTREILAFASTAVAGDVFADIEGEERGADSIEDVMRSGPSPVVGRFRSRAEHDAALVEALRRTDCPRADVGVLCATNYGVRDVRRALEAAGIPSIDLADYTGVPVDAVKVGTIKRAKGLEFKAVLVARVQPDLIDAPTPDDESAVIRRRELYVGMTRARDHLWLGVCA
jgi:superfamily I DNA/RNA helicase